MAPIVHAEKPGPEMPPACCGAEEFPRRLVGIARLAANSPLAETQSELAGNGRNIFVLPVRLDSEPIAIRSGCRLNGRLIPYRGCEFACKYCYARYTHEYMELDGSEFEKERFFVKKDAAALLVQDMRKYSYESKSFRRSVPGSYCDWYGD